MIKKKCIACEKEFETKNSRRKYCSIRCLHKVYDKKYWEENKEKIKERRKDYFKEYRQKNKEKISEKSKKHYLKNKERILERQKLQYQKGKQKFLLTYKFGKSCALCSWNKHPEILEFHHKDRNKKNFTIGNKRSTLLSENYLKQLNEEISKCILICPNCHLLLHIKENAL